MKAPTRDLMKFLYEADHSPMLLMLDALTAAPQQRITRSTPPFAFRPIVREPAMPEGLKQ